MIPLLIDLLQCRNDVIAAKAAEALAVLGDPNATEPLIRTLLNRERLNRQWRIWRPILLGGILGLIVFIAIITEGNVIGSSGYAIAQAIIALLAYNQWSRFRQKSVEALGEQVQELLPELRERVLRRAEARVLLRAPTPEAEAATLLRSATSQPDIPNEQLLRPAE